MPRPPGDPILINATIHLGKAPGGGSSAQFYKADDGKLYLVKLKGNGQGIRVLANEYICGRLGELIGVPCGEHLLINVGDALHPPNGIPQISQGIHFATTFYDHAQSDSMQLRHTTNFSAFPSVVVFDTFIALKDSRQHLTYPSSGDPNGAKDIGVIIDQGHALTGNPSWDLSTLNANPDCNILDGLGLKPDFPAISFYEPYLHRVEAISKDEMRALVNEAPLQEWQVSQQEAEGLVEWFETRKTRLRPAIEAFLR